MYMHNNISGLVTISIICTLFVCNAMLAFWCTHTVKWGVKLLSIAGNWNVSKKVHTWWIYTDCMTPLLGETSASYSNGIRMSLITLVSWPHQGWLQNLIVSQPPWSQNCIIMELSVYSAIVKHKCSAQQRVWQL